MKNSDTGQKPGPSALPFGGHGRLVLSVAISAAIALAAPAQAQQTEPVRDDSQEVLELDAIVVTVQRRVDRLIDVPIAISSMSADQLSEAGVIGLFDLKTVMPGVRVDQYGAYTQPTIRGIGTQDIQGPGANANVAIYIDGFYQPSQAGNIFEFANIERVDVLKGPQGTLFGQNATGGALVITTADPDFVRSGKVSLGVGSFDELRGNLYATGGLTDTLAADISLYYRESDGYFDNISTGEPTAPVRNQAIRSKLLWQPNDDSTLVLSLGYTDIDNAIGLSQTTTNPVAQFYHDVFGVPIIATTEPYKTSLNEQPRANPKTFTAGLKGVFDFNGTTLTSLTQYRDQDTSVRADLDGTTVRYWQVEYEETERTFTQEFNLAGKRGDAFDWFVGAFYYHNVGRLQNNAYQDFFNTGIRTNWLYSDVEVTTDSIAVFVDGTYRLADRWWLTAGGRYTSEKKSLDSQGLLDPFEAFTDSTRWNEFTPRLALRFAVSDFSNVYASYGQGFMSGNYGYTTVGPQKPVDPEKITQYEIGYKFARGGWSFDAAAYYSDYRDLQVFRFMDDCACFRIDNAPEAESYGAEARLLASVTDRLTINTGVAYNRATYKDYVGAGLSGDPLIPPNYGFATIPTDFSGGTMIRAPEWTANLGGTYFIPTSNGPILLSGNYYYTSKIPMMPAGQLSQSPYGLLNLSAQWRSPQDVWSVTVFGNNVADKEYLLFSAEGFLGRNQIWGAPASWGVQAEYRF